MQEKGTEAKTGTKIKTKANIKAVRHIKRFWPYYVMVTPGVIYLLVFRYIPMLGSVIAFQNFSVVKGIAGSDWTGWKNFQKLFQYQDFYKILKNTVILGALKILAVLPVPVLLSLMLNEVKNQKLKKGIQTVICIPYFLSWVIIGGLVFDLFGSGGLFNHIRNALGMKNLLVMQKESWFRPIYVFSSIWKEAGWGTVVYLAAISGMDPGIYESASIDGAGRFQKMRYITFPLLTPTVLTMFLLNIGSFLELGFEQVYNLYTPMTYAVADIFDTYVYRAGIQQGQYSFATAVGLFQSVVGLVLVVIFNHLSRKYSQEGGLW